MGSGKLESYDEPVQENFVDAFPYVKAHLEDADGEIYPGEILVQAGTETGRETVEQTLFVMEREGVLRTSDYTSYSIQGELNLEEWQETYEHLRRQHNRLEKSSGGNTGKSLDDIAEEHFG